MINYKKLLSITALIACSYAGMAQHSIVLKSGEKLEGIVLSLQNDMWNIFIDGEERSIHMKEISSLFFSEYIAYDGILLPNGQEEVMQVNGFTVKYQIKDRKMIQKPKVSIGTEDKGTVVVKVVVDRYGNILSAEPGQAGSTTSNKYLYTKAKIAAQSVKFDENLKGPLKTEGLITIIY